mmetsp:Transcript_83997/g.180054  ORF Transcript_83997/g.180054 Transcript_83997/m.180054 type:complete len:731 (-) Transcript_83997:56-2248(-)
MKSFSPCGVAALLSAILLCGRVEAVAVDSMSRAHAQVNPVQRVVRLLDDLEAKVTKDGEVEEKAYAGFQEWCKGGSKDKEFEIKTAQSDIEDLTATIDKANSDIATQSSKIEDLAGAITVNQGDLKAATQIRDKEVKEFTAVEAEMADTIDTLERAINVLERKLHSSSLLQAKLNGADIDKLVQVLSTVVDAAALSLHDKQKLIGLVQSGNGESDDSLEADLGAPAPEAYKTRSGSILDVLEDLKQKAVTQLEQARREETNARHNFELLKQSLEDQVKVDERELGEAKSFKHDATETKATTMGSLQVTKQDLSDATSVLKNMKSDCMSKAADHETSVTNRAEELKAIAAAKDALAEVTGAASLTYNQASFLQLASNGADAARSGLRTRADLANFEVVNLVRKLAKEQKSAALAQLAGSISAAMQAGVRSGQDPFEKVKNLISGMIERLIKEGGEEADHKAYCDKEMAETTQKIDGLKFTINKYSSKIDKAKADSVNLKDEVATLQGEIAEIVRSQAEADALRKEELKVYTQSKADLEQGLSGVRMALRILRDYYAGEEVGATSLVQQPEASGVHSKSSGSGTTIIGMLEVVESDFGKGLASVEMNEEASAAAYQRMTIENKVSKSVKDKDVQYKVKEAAALDKSVSELSSDRDSAQTELDAVLQYSANIRGMCEVKPETYEERKGRREAEIAGLKEALQILEGEAVLLQVRAPRGMRHLRRAVALQPHEQ